MPHLTHTTTFSGIPGAAGIGIGTVVAVYPLIDLYAVPDHPAEDIEAEIALFDSALIATQNEINAMSARLTDILSPEEQALFDAYSHILSNESLGTEVKAEIREGHWAQGALRRVMQQHIQQFEAMEDEYLRDLALDFRDLGRRVLKHLQAAHDIHPDYPSQTVLAGDELTASILAEVPHERLAGIVSMRGSANSHVAILARALGVPAVMGIREMMLTDIESQKVIVDGYAGRVHLNPPLAIEQEFIQLAQQQRQLDAELEDLRNLTAETQDGHQVALAVNIGLTTDAGIALRAGAEAIGLYRTEVPFMIKERFPTEEEQRAIYRQLLLAFTPRPVTMRTLDVGGDKMLPYFPVTEDNPFLGWRGIRITLDHPAVFLSQVRAMLLASEGLNNLRIMLPMISHVSEVDESIRLIQQAYQEVSETGAVIYMPEIGVMIEVPSAVYQAHALAERVDFLSVGSNDLTQYLLAVDRNNPRVAKLYDSLHPAVLQALIQIVNSAHHAGKPVSICGEMTSDPASVILLMAMGFDSLSMNSTCLPRIKWVIRNFTLRRAQEILAEVLTMEDPAQIRELLTQALADAGLSELLPS